MAVGIVASASSGAQSSVASFNIGTLGTGARAGIVFVVTYGNSGAAIETGVTWNGTAMSLLYSGADTNTEPGIVRAYFLDNVTNGNVTVSRTNNTVVCVGYAASISALGATEAYQTKTVGGAGTINTNANTSESGTAASNHYAVDDGSPGTNSMRFAASYTGNATPIAANATSSTGLQTHDATAYGSSFVRETTAGQGSRNVGFATGTTDDWAVVAVAVREVPPDPKLAEPTAASLTLTGATPTVLAADPKLSQPTAASLTLTGATPTVATPVVCLPTPAGGSAYSSTILADSPVGYWRLGESSGNPQDSSGNDNHVTSVTGTPTYSVTGALTGDSNTAVTLDGSAYFSVPYDATFDVADVFTLEAWVTRPTATGTIIHKGYGSYLLRILSTGDEGPAWCIELVRNDVAEIVESTSGIPATGWHHVVATKTGSTVKLYLDGSDVTGTVSNSTFTDNESGQVIGLNLSGSIDEVAVYPTALSSTRVTAHYTAGTSGGGLRLTGATPTVSVTAGVTSEPTAASLTLTGATPAVATPVVSLPTAGALTLTGDTPTVSAGANVVSEPTAGALTLTGDTPAVVATANVSAEPTAASLILSGDTPAVATPATAEPTAASLTLTADTPAVAAAQTYVPTEASLVLSGDTPAVVTPVAVQPDAAALTTSMGTPTVAAPVLVLPDAASLSLAGDTPTVTAAQTYAPDAAALTLTTGTPAIVLPVATQPDAAALTLTGDTPAVATPVAVQPDLAALALTGAEPTVVAPYTAEPTAASLVIQGAVPNVVASAPGVVVPDPAALVLTGATPAVTLPILPTAAALVLTGATPDVVLTDHVQAQPTPAALLTSMATPTVAVAGDVDVLPGPATLTLLGRRPSVRITGTTPPTRGRAQFRPEAKEDLEQDDEDVLLMWAA